MKTFLLFAVAFLSLNAGAQVISRFTWESSPVTTAVAGANALSVSSYAVSSTGGANGSRGLNPGNGSNDINLVLDGASFNVPALDISVAFRREESQASFFYRGSHFNFGMNGGNLFVSFQVKKGESAATINSGNVYSIPDDHSFHTYRFNYDNNTGTAKMWANGVLVYTYSGTAGVPLYWTGAGNVTIGKDMDATGRNIAVLDNMVIQQYSNALLPLKLLSFDAEVKNKFALINWITTEEVNVAAYILEKSFNGVSFSSLTAVAAVNGYTAANHYTFTDSLPLGPVVYYRLKMINSDGSAAYSPVKTVSFSLRAATAISVFPNPTADYAYIKITNADAGKYLYTVSSANGQPIAAATVQLGSGTQQIQIDLGKIQVKGILVIQVRNLQTNATSSFSVLKK